MNVLKPNNRFSSLLEDNRPVHTRRVNESRYINKYKTDTKNDKKNPKMNPVNININMNDFPELIGTQTNANVGDVTHNYVTKLLYQPNIEPATDEVLPYGWVVITPNKYKTHIKPSKPTNPNWEKAMDSLVKLYNKRKDEYIALWGKETYENIFLFPNYDYDYYDYEDEDEDEDDEYEYEYEYDEYYN